LFFLFASRRRHTRLVSDWSSDVCSSDLAPLLDWALKRPRATIAAAAAVVVLSFALVPAIGFSLFPKAETPQVYVNITAPEGASIAVTDSATRFAERVLGRRPEVRAIRSEERRVGKEGRSRGAAGHVREKQGTEGGAAARR